MALDYTNIAHEDILLADIDTILDKPKPYYIPDINEFRFSGYNDDRFVFQFAKIEDGKYILDVNFGEGKGKKDKIASYYGMNVKDRDIDAAHDFAVVSLDVMVATQEYYRLKRKAQLKKIADDKNKAQADKWASFSNEDKERYLGYWSIPDKVRGEYTKETWAALPTEEKEAFFNKHKVKPYKLIKAGRVKIMEDNRMPTSQHTMYQEMVDHGYTNTRYSSDNAAWKEYLETKELMRFKAGDMEIQKEDWQSSFTKGRETSYGDSGTKDDLLATHGVKVKTQNGSEISEEQINEIKTHLDNVYRVFGDRSSMSKNFGLKISHSGDKLMHARKAVGIYFPAFKAIGVSATYGTSEFGFTLAHEFGHFMDNYAGKKGKRHFASDNYESTAGQIAKKFRKLMNKPSDSKYMNRTCECFARAMEQYHAVTVEGEDARRFGGDRYYDDPVQVNKENFQTHIVPLIQQFLQENDHLLKSAYDQLNLIDINNNFEIIKSAFDNNDIAPEKFLEYHTKYNELVKGDPSHEGKLVKKVIMDSRGRKEIKWVKREEAGKDKDDKKKEPAEPVKHSKNVLSAYAKETPANELKRIINESSDPKLRAAAHAELDRRERLEKKKDSGKKKK